MSLLKLSCGLLIQAAAFASVMVFVAMIYVVASAVTA